MSIMKEILIISVLLLFVFLESKTQISYNIQNDSPGYICSSQDGNTLASMELLIGSPNHPSEGKKALITDVRHIIRPFLSLGTEPDSLKRDILNYYNDIFNESFTNSIFDEIEILVKKAVIIQLISRSIVDDPVCLCLEGIV